MPVLNDSYNLQLSIAQVLKVMHRGVDVWTLPVPVNTVAPVLSGGTSAPADLSVTNNGTWTNSPDTYSYQLQEFVAGEWEDVTGETGSTYDDLPVGAYSVLVWGENEFGPRVLPARSNSIIVTSGVARVWGFDTVPHSDGGFPGQANRALGSKFVKSHDGRITQLNVRFRSTTIAGADGKLVAHADDAGGTVPGTKLWESQPFTIPAGASLQNPGLPTSGIENTDGAASYWLIFVPSDFHAEVAKSNTLSEGQTVMANGTYSYASPPTAWPGTDFTYDGPIAAWGDYIG